MAIIHFQNKSFLLEEGETILDTFKRNGVNFPYSCQSGVCQSCLAKLISGEMLPSWQRDLKDVYKAKNYFLPCIAKPIYDIQIELPNNIELSFSATVISIKKLSPNVIGLYLAVENLEHWIPGQYLNLINPEGLIRSYSIANLPKEDGYIELHIKLYPQGAMSQWFNHHLTLGLHLFLRGPIGDCFYYNPNNENFDMVLAGTGTGLAPLIAIVRDALLHHHTGTIYLLHGGYYEYDLYYQDIILNLTYQYPNFRYLSCVLKSEGNIKESDINEEFRKIIINPNHTKAYICGPQETAKQLKKTAFLAGIASKNIFSDIFVMKS